MMCTQNDSHPVVPPLSDLHIIVIVLPDHSMDLLYEGRAERSMQHEAKLSAALTSRPAPNTINSHTVVWWYNTIVPLMRDHKKSSQKMVSQKGLVGNQELKPLVSLPDYPPNKANPF